jgi:hypothetical protein
MRRLSNQNRHLFLLVFCFVVVKVQLTLSKGLIGSKHTL